MGRLNSFSRHTPQLGLQRLSGFFKARFAQQSEHIFFVCFHAWLVEGIHFQHITTDPAGAGLMDTDIFIFRCSFIQGSSFYDICVRL